MKLNAIITESFLSSGFPGDTLEAQLYQAKRRVADIEARMADPQHSPVGCPPGRERLLTIRHMDQGAPWGSLKRELVAAGFQPGDEVVIIKRSVLERVRVMLSAAGLGTAMLEDAPR